jgi:hypothetical protein
MASKGDNLLDEWMVVLYPYFARESLPSISWVGQKRSNINIAQECGSPPRFGRQIVGGNWN